MRKSIPWIIIGVLACLLIGWASTRRPPGLVDRAERVPGFRYDGMAQLSEIGWYSPAEVCLADPSARSPLAYIRLNIRTGAQSSFVVPVPELKLPRNTIQTVSCSPDTRFVLYKTMTKWRLATMDGRVLHDWPMVGWWSRWSADSKQWVEVDESSHAVL